MRRMQPIAVLVLGLAMPVVASAQERTIETHGCPGAGRHPVAGHLPGLRASDDLA